MADTPVPSRHGLRAKGSRRSQGMILRAMICALVFVGLWFTTAGRADAHTELVQSDPAADRTLTSAPAEVVLTFGQDIESAFATVVVRRGDGVQWPTSPPEVAGRQVRSAIKGTLPPGAVTISYRVVSADGHPITGSFRFSVATPGATVAAAQDTKLAGTQSGVAQARGGPGSGRTSIVTAVIAGLLIGSSIIAIQTTRKVRIPRR